MRKYLRNWESENGLCRTTIRFQPEMFCADCTTRFSMHRENWCALRMGRFLM